MVKIMPFLHSLDALCQRSCEIHLAAGLARIIVGASPTTLTLYGPVAIFVFEVNLAICPPTLRSHLGIGFRY